MLVEDVDEHHVICQLNITPMLRLSFCLVLPRLQSSLAVAQLVLGHLTARQFQAFAHEEILRILSCRPLRHVAHNLFFCMALLCFSFRNLRGDFCVALNRILSDQLGCHFRQL